jgi:hypothetical protein
MKALSWINVSLGVWLMVTAFALSAGDAPIMAQESVAGIMIAVLAYASAVGPPSPGISCSVAIAGLWTLIVNYGVLTPPRLNATIVGAIVILLGAGNAIHRQFVPRTHG